MQFIFYSKEQRQNLWKFFSHRLFFTCEEKGETSPCRNSYEWKRMEQHSFLLEVFGQLILFGLNSKSDNIIIIGLLTGFSVDAFPYTFTVKTLWLFSSDLFQRISIYSDIIFLSKSWLCTLFCKLSTSSSWLNFFRFCCHFSTASSNS